MAQDKTQRVLDALTWIEDDIPVEALEEADDLRETLSPRLLRALEQVAAGPDSATEPGYALHLHAVALLAQWREPAAYAPIVALMRLPSDTLDALFGDFVSVVMGRALASVCGGDLAPIRALARDPDVDTYAREAALEALVVCAFEEDLDRHALTEELIALAQHEIAELPRVRDFEDETQLMPTWIASRLADVADAAHWPLVESWFDAGVIDEETLDAEECRMAMETLWEVRQDEALEMQVGYIDDAADTISRWVLDAAQADGAEEEGELLHGADAGTYVRDTPKVGRNDACPCGSGKKYKQCCGEAG